MKMNKKGFTLIEMLVVIAIIAILVAIVVPTVTKATDKAKAATDAANVRAAMAEAQIYVLSNEISTTTAHTFTSTEAKTVGTAAKYQAGFVCVKMDASGNITGEINSKADGTGTTVQTLAQLITAAGGKDATAG